MFLSNPLRSILSSIVVTISLLAIIPSPAYSNILPIRSQFVRSPGSSLHGCREDGDFPDLRKATPTLSGVTIDNAQDSFYSVGIVIAGQDIEVRLDTGSTDLWVYTPYSILQVNNKTSIRVTEAYGNQVASGPISFANVTIGKYNIPNQAFVDADTVKNFPSDVHGILGMSFGAGAMYQAMEKSYGNGTAAQLGKSPVLNIFAQHPTLSNFFDIYLSRTNDLDNINDGTLTVNEHLDGYYQAVSVQPKLERVTNNSWSVALDSIQVNSKTLKFNTSSIKTVPEGKIAAFLGTGYSYPRLSPAAVDYIYSSIAGAVLSDGRWLVPCLGATNLTFVFGDRNYPVHPLDLTVPALYQYEEGGKTKNVTYCSNSYQYTSTGSSNSEEFDVILGDAFLRNVYASFNHGDSNSNVESDSQPYVQLLSLTEQNDAWKEFHEARTKALNHLPPVIDPADFLKLTQTMSNSSSSVKLMTSGAVSQDDTSTAAGTTSLVGKYTPIVVGLLAGNLLVGVGIFFLGIFACTRSVIRGGAKTSVLGSSYTAVSLKSDD